MRVLVTGATGYIGGRLVPKLLEAGYTVRCFARASTRLRGRFEGDVEILEGDLEDPHSLEGALHGCDAAYYLVHFMASTKRFATADRDAAKRFGEAARRSGVSFIVYLGGLGDEADELSPHLRSRHEVGDVLRKSGVPVIEFRAAQIIGSGSMSFEMVRYLTERLPVMVAPRWVQTRCQPIGIRDVLAYLVAAISRPAKNAVYEIGGSDVMTYKHMMLRYAAIRNLKRFIVVVPFFTPKLSSYWVHLITPIPAKLAQPLIEGLYNEVVVREGSAARDFPEIRPSGFEEAVRIALDRSYTPDRETTWFDAYAAHAPKGDFVGIEEGMLIDCRKRSGKTTPDKIAEVFCSLGGDRGWLAARGLWRVRGWLDRCAGGSGLRRGRRSATNLRVGDAIDFWRVEEYEPNRLLRLRAEMILPGRAWLQFEAQAGPNGESTLLQSAFFEPRGLWGYLYWYAVSPFHELVFAKMAERIVRAAE